MLLGHKFSNTVTVHLITRRAREGSIYGVWLYWTVGQFPSQERHSGMIPITPLREARHLKLMNCLLLEFSI